MVLLNTQEYPFKARKHHGLEYIRQFPHLRARTNSFSSLLRIRHTATMAIHEFFQKENFLHVHTPILTSSDCEGAGDLFEVKVGRYRIVGNFKGFNFTGRQVLWNISQVQFSWIHVSMCMYQHAYLQIVDLL